MVIVVGHDPVSLFVRSRHAKLTYPEVGRTRSPVLPDGYRHDRHRLNVGHGEMAWARAKDAIRQWKAHAHAGITITPPGAPLQEDSTVIASRAFGPLTILAPCRIIYVTEEESRFGFAYGTLPGHPETGEEAFHVARATDGTVSAEIISFSRSADLATKLAGPVARQIQRAVTQRYLQGIARHTAAVD